MANDFDYAQALQNAVSPLNLLAQKNLTIGAENRAQARNIQSMTLENQFVTARNAAQIAAEAQNRREEETQRAANVSKLSAQESAQRITQAASDADITRDNQIYAKAQLYKLPIHNDDGSKIPADELNEDIGDAAGKQAAAIHSQIAANNSKLAGLTVPLPDIQAAAQAAARNIANNPIIASQVKPETMAKVQALVAAQGTNPLGLANLIYNSQHGIGSYAIFGGGKDSAQSSIIQSALAEEMDKQIAAQTNVKSQQAMFQMKAVAQQNEVLQGKYEQYFQDASPDAQLKLLSPTAVTNAATGGTSAASSSDPANYTPLKTPPAATPGMPRTAGTPHVGAVTPSAITQHFKTLSSADDAMSRAQQLAQLLTDLTNQKQAVHQKTMPGSGESDQVGNHPPADNEPGNFTGSLPYQPAFRTYSNSEKAAASQQEDAIDAQIASTQGQLGAALQTVKNLKGQVLGVPAAPAAPAQPAYTLPPVGQPVIPQSDTQPATDPATLQMMTKLANADGMGASQIQALMQASQAGNPQASQTIMQYHQRATAALQNQDNPFTSAQSQYTLPPVGQPVIPQSDTQPAYSLPPVGQPVIPQ